MQGGLPGDDVLKNRQVRKSAEFGDLVAAAFDEAAHHCTDPRQVSRLARMAVVSILRRSRKTSLAPKRLRRLFLELAREYPTTT